MMAGDHPKASLLFRAGARDAGAPEWARVIGVRLAKVLPINLKQQ